MTGLPRSLFSYLAYRITGGVKTDTGYRFPTDG
jgi:hypothetical protein